jgi:hypothetical protein
MAASEASRQRDDPLEEVEVMLRIGGTVIDNCGNRGVVVHQESSGAYVVDFGEWRKSYWRKEIRDVDDLPHDPYEIVDVSDAGIDAYLASPDRDVTKEHYDKDGRLSLKFEHDSPWASEQEAQEAKAFDWKPPLHPNPSKDGTLTPIPVDVVRARIFESGASRDVNEDKLHYARFFSPDVLRRRAEYMHKHRILSDGTLRDPDNWKKGIPIEAYIDSLIRHVIELWLYYYGETDGEVFDDLEAKLETLCAICFNAEGMMFEEMKA